MTKIKKPTRCTNTEQTNIKQVQRHFTESAKRVKLEFIRLAIWLQMAWGYYA